MLLYTDIGNIIENCFFDESPDVNLPHSISYDDNYLWVFWLASLKHEPVKQFEQNEASIFS